MLEIKISLSYINRVVSGPRWREPREAKTSKVKKQERTKLLRFQNLLSKLLTQKI